MVELKQDFFEEFNFFLQVLIFHENLIVLSLIFLSQVSILLHSFTQSFIFKLHFLYHYDQKKLTLSMWILFASLYVMCLNISISKSNESFSALWRDFKSLITISKASKEIDFASFKSDGCLSSYGSSST